jgi:transglutaminase-like putative cysteine protease
MTPAIIREGLHRRHVWSLIGALVMVSAPHVVRLPVWATLLVIAFVGWRLYLTHAGLKLPNRWLLLLLSAGAMAGIYAYYGNILARDSGLALLIVMLGLKLLEMSKRRDAIVLVFLCYFVVITNFLYSQNIATALYMLGALWIITAALNGLQVDGEHFDFRRQLGNAGLMLVQAVPLMLVLFVLFPRISVPLWRMPPDNRSAATGLSDTMAPGSVSNLRLSDAVAFRVKFNDRMPPPSQLYWRGPVMWDFDGRTWSVSRDYSFVPHKLSALNQAVSYTVTIEPHARRWLFALDLPVHASAPSRLTSEFDLLSPIPVSHRLRYDVVSYLAYRDDGGPAPGELRRALALPDHANPRTIELAHRMRAQAGDERGFVTAVLTMFHDQDFYYTMNPPPLGGNPVDEFLFSTRAGFCEHYASAFTVLMRAGGIPARIVTGYQGGELNTFGDYLTVRQDDAHAWAEVWLADRGWTRIDPTAAVSPARVEAGAVGTRAEFGFLPMAIVSDNPWLHRARMAWDSVQNSWNQTVLGYTQDAQHELMRRMGMNDTWTNLVTLLAGATTLIVALLAALLLHRVHAKRMDPVLAAYARFCNRLARRGLLRAPSEGPYAYMRRASEARPKLAPSIQRITNLYVELRYGNAGAAERELLQRAVRQFRA